MRATTPDAVAAAFGVLGDVGVAEAPMVVFRVLGDVVVPGLGAVAFGMYGCAVVLGFGAAVFSGLAGALGSRVALVETLGVADAAHQGSLPRPPFQGRPRCALSHSPFAVLFSAL